MCWKDRPKQSKKIKIKPIRNKHVLTNTQLLSYHFSHLGVNVFVATCQTPTCFEFSTRVLAPLPCSTGNADKRAIIVLLFRVPHELLTFWRTWQGSLFLFFYLTPHFDKWPTTSSERGQRRPADSTISLSRGGANWANTARKWAQTLCPFIYSWIQISPTRSELIYTRETFGEDFLLLKISLQSNRKSSGCGVSSCVPAERMSWWQRGYMNGCLAQPKKYGFSC